MTKNKNKEKDGILRLLNEVNVFIDIANEEEIPLEQMIGTIVILASQVTKDCTETGLDALITHLTLLKYDRMGILKEYEKAKVKKLL